MKNEERPSFFIPSSLPTGKETRRALGTLPLPLAPRPPKISVVGRMATFFIWHPFRDSHLINLTIHTKSRRLHRIRAASHQHGGAAVCSPSARVARGVWR